MNSLNSRIQTKKVWDKFRKVNRNYKLRTIPPLKRGGNIITTLEEISYTFADHYANISRDPHKKGKPGKNKEKELPYNESLTAIKQQKYTAPGEDTIHPQRKKKDYYQRH